MYLHTSCVYSIEYLEVMYICMLLCKKNSWLHVRLIEWMKTSNYFVSMCVFQFKIIQKFACLQTVQIYD